MTERGSTVTNVGNVVITAENGPTNHRKEKEQLFIRFMLLLFLEK